MLYVVLKYLSVTISSYGAQYLMEKFVLVRFKQVLVVFRGNSHLEPMPANVAAPHLIIYNCVNYQRKFQYHDNLNGQNNLGMQ